MTVLESLTYRSCILLLGFCLPFTLEMQAQNPADAAPSRVAPGNPAGASSTTNREEALRQNLRTALEARTNALSAQAAGTNGPSPRPGTRPIPAPRLDGNVAPAAGTGGPGTP